MDTTQNGPAAVLDTPTAAAEWNFDASHSGIEFSIKHFFTPVSGKFTEYDVDLAFDRENPANSHVSVQIDVSSIDTGNKDRNAHLMTADFFDAEMFSAIKFESKTVTMVGDDRLVARGPLTIKDRTHEIEMPITLLGVKDVPTEMQAAFGGITEVASFTAKLDLNRNDYDVGTGSWAATAVVGREVHINIAVEANR